MKRYYLYVTINQENQQILNAEMQEGKGPWVKYEDAKNVIADVAINAGECDLCVKPCKRVQVGCRDFQRKGEELSSVEFGDPVYCADCVFIRKPCGAAYESHPDSICCATVPLSNDFISKKPRYQVGLRCADANHDGKCKSYQKIKKFDAAYPIPHCEQGYTKKNCPYKTTEKLRCQSLHCPYRLSDYEP